MGHKGLEKCAIAVIIPGVTLVGHSSLLFNNKAVVISCVSVSILTEVESRITREYREARLDAKTPASTYWKVVVVIGSRIHSEFKFNANWLISWQLR